MIGLYRVTLMVRHDPNVPSWDTETVEMRAHSAADAITQAPFGVCGFDVRVMGVEPLPADGDACPLAPVLDRIDVAVAYLGDLLIKVQEQTDFMKGATTHERSESRLNGPDDGRRGD